MREKTLNQKSKNKLFMIRGLGIIFAFVVVFALVLAFGAYDGNITTDSTNQIAFAGTSDPSGTNDTTVCTFTIDNLEDITASSIGYPGTSSTTSFTTGDVGTSQTSFSNQSNISYSYKGGLANPDAPSPSFSANNGTYKLSYDAAKNNRYEYGWSVVNFDMSSNPIFYKLLTSSVISNVKAVVAGTVSYDSHNEKSGYYVDCSITGKTASNYSCGDNASGITTSSGSFSKELTIKSSSTDTPKAFISLLIYCRTGHKGLLDNYDMYPGYSQISGLTIKFTFTRNNNYKDTSATTIDDGAAPQITSFDFATTNLKTSPYRPDNTQDNDDWNVWYDTSTITGAKVASLLSKAKDIVTVGSKVKLYSYSSGSQFSFIWNNITSYKRISFTATDYFDYDGTGDSTAAGSSFPLQAAGIKSIEVGDMSSVTTNSAFFSLGNDANAFKHTVAITTGSTTSDMKKIYYYQDETLVECGYAYVKRDADFPSGSTSYSSRNTVTVVIYFTKNCDITVTVADYGDRTVKQKIEVRGIDVAAPNAPTLSQDDGMLTSTANNYGNINWIYTNTFDFDGTDNSDALEDSLWYSPHVYYYEIQKLGNATTESDPTKPFPGHTNLTKQNLKDRLPFAVGTFDGFSYDFTKGCTSNGIYPSGSNVSNNASDNYCKGNGYYRIYIYTLDLAGNMSSTIRTYYCKVDHEEAVYDYEMTYSFNGTNCVITSANNGTWATSALVATITQNKVSLSGNVIVFEDAGGEYHSIYIGSYATQLKSAGTADGPCIAKIDGNLLANIPTLTIGGNTCYEIVENQIYFTATQLAYGNTSYIYKLYFLPDIANLEIYATLDYTMVLEIANGTDYDAAEVVYHNSSWRDSYGNDGIVIRVDRMNPSAPSVYDDDNKFIAIDISSTLPTDLGSLGINASTQRNWYTSGYNINAGVNFPEGLADVYPNDIRVYLGIINVELSESIYVGFKTLSQFTSIDQATRTNVVSYGNALNGIFGSGYWRSIYAGDFVDNAAEIPGYNLFTQFGIGLRVVYAWAIDQAGNMGDIQVQYILVDPTTYYLTTRVNSDDVDLFGVDEASIIATDENDNTITSFKRGDVLNVRTSISSDFVIYTLTKIVGGNERILGLNIASTDLLESQDETFVSYDNGLFTIIADIASVFEYYNTETTVSDSARVYLELTYRKVIYPSVTATYARYAGIEFNEPLVKVPFIMSDMSTTAQASLTFTFYTDENYSVLTNDVNAGILNGEPGSTPVNVGTYYVEINSNSALYVVNQPVRSPFTIVAANLRIQVNEDVDIQYLQTTAITWESIVTVTGLLGDAIDNYAYYGLTIFDQGAFGLKDIQGVVQDLTEIIPVGAYSVYQETTFELANYNITFVANKIEVVPYEITAHIASDEKIFGDADTIRSFDIPIATFSSIGVTWDEVFAASRVTVEPNGAYYKFTPQTQWIKRVAGEDIGVYDIYTTTADFVIISSNYTVVLTYDSAPKFTINKRQMEVIPVSGQKYEDDAIHMHVDNIRYTFNSKDATFFTDEYITGELALSADPINMDDTSVPGRVIYTYLIEMGTLASRTNNIELFFDSGVEFTVTIVSGEVIRVSHLSMVEFPYNRGVSSTDLEWNKTDFQTDLPDSFTYENYSISWSIGAIAANSPVGTYPVDVISPTVYDSQGHALTQYTVVVNTFYVTITPLPITITPIISNNTKIYGNYDKLSWDIGFTAIREGDDMSSLIEPGEFIRAVFRKSDNTLLALGTRFDGVSDINGELTYEGIPAYYGLDLRIAFETKDSNYYVEYADYSDVRFTITTRKIVVDPETSFYGVNKHYDGSLTAIYAAGETSIVISDYVAREKEDVYVSFNAEYDSANAGTNKSITFSNLGLAGSAAHNYVLYFGTASENVPYVAQTVTINKLIPTVPTGPDNVIEIYSVIISIHKSDFAISKQYDGTTAMTAKDVTIDDTSVLKTFNFTVNASSYPSFEVSNAYSTNVTIVFTYESSESTDNMHFEDNDDSDITVVDDGAGKITVILHNMPVSITKKILTIDDIVGIEGVNKYYDASSKIQVVPTISSEALAFGDTTADTFIQFVARAATLLPTEPAEYDNSIEYNDTTYYVVYEKNVSTEPYHVFLEDVSITSAASNYILDISNYELATFSYLNRENSSVIINKATLNLSALIGAAEYTGVAAIDSSLISTATQVTSAISSDLIVTSSYDPANITAIYNELANITYNYDSIKAYYTKDGGLYPYVALNEDGSLAKHEISIANLILSKHSTSGLTEEQINAILANYTLAGTAYTISDEGATAVEADPFELELGTIISADVYTAGGKGLSSIITATLNKKTIQINATYITLPNKVYDGTTLGSATVDDLLAIGIVPSDADKINVTLTATYATKDVGTKIRVDISNVTFTDKEQYDVNHSSNYAIGTSSAYAYRAITKSYAVIDFDLATKVYDGTNSVAQSSIMPIISVPYSRDDGLYSVNTSFAFLGSADVVTDLDDKSDKATIYGIKLVSSRTTVNYDLFIKKSVEFELYENGVKTPEFEAYIAEPENALISLEATDFYYALNGTNDVYFALRIDTVKTVRVKDYTGPALEIGDDVPGYGTYLGYYVSNTIRYYAFASSEPEAKEYYAMDITAQYSHYVQAATLAFTIKPGTGSSSFTKEYDGTADLTEPYVVEFETGLTQAEKDAIEAALVGKYSTANVGSSTVVFTIKDNVALNNTNYTVTDIKVSVAGYITKSIINAYLEDTEVPYGTLITNRKYNIIYSTNAYDNITSSAPLINRARSDKVDIFVVDGKFGYYQISSDGSAVEGKKYYTFTPTYKQVSITKFSSDRHYYYIEGDVYTEGTLYDSSKTYYICDSIVYEETEFSVLTDMYEFVPISGTIIAPAIKTSVTNSTNAKAEGYPMYLNGGSAANFNFKYSYTNGTNSKLIVTKVTLYAYVIDDYTDEEGSSVNYASSVVYKATGTMPQFALGYAASPTTMLSGFVNGQTSAIFNQSANTAPITKVYLFDGTDYVQVSSMATCKVTEELEAGQYYLIYIDISEAVAVNYTFALKTGDEIENCAKLLLEYPEITDYSVADTTVTYNATAQNVKVTGTGATVTYQYYTNKDMTTLVGTSVTNAGEYYAKVTISKPQYKTLVQYAALTIKKANFKITIPSIDVDYDGDDHTVEIRTSAIAPSKSSINVKYEINGYEYSGARNVGSYFVTATYTTKANSNSYNGGQYNDNFNSATGTGSIVVQGAVVQVIVNDADKIAKLDKSEEPIQMNFTISVDEKYKDMLEAAGYDYDNYIEDLLETEIIYIQYYSAESASTDDYLTEITETGVYNYVIAAENGANIILKGSVSGTFTVGVESIEYLNSAEKRRALITAQGNTILSANASIVYEKVTYTAKVNSQSSAEVYKNTVANNKLYTQIESNIPSLATMFHDTELLGVLKVQMRVNASDGTSYLIQPNGKVKVSVYPTVAIDDTTKIYQVTADGKLSEVNYTYSNGFVTYETDYVNTIVFVKVGTFLEYVTTNWWLIAVAAGALVAILIIIIVPSVVVTSKKKKAKKAAALAAAGAGAAGTTAPVAETAAPAQEAAPTSEPVEEPAPIEEPAPVDEPPMDDMPPVEEPPMEEPPVVEPEPVELAPVEEPAPAPEKPQGPPPGAVGKKAPPPGAVGQKPDAAPKKAPPPGAVGQKPAAAPKKAPPPGAIGKK